MRSFSRSKRSSSKLALRKFRELRGRCLPHRPDWGKKGVGASMRVDTFTISRWADGAVDVVKLTGEFDLSACPAFRRETVGVGDELLVVDLREVTFLDSHALGALVELQNGAQDHGFRLAILRPTGYADRIFSITGTEAYLPLFDERVPLLAEMNYG